MTWRITSLLLSSYPILAKNPILVSINLLLLLSLLLLLLLLEQRFCGSGGGGGGSIHVVDCSLLFSIIISRLVGCYCYCYFYCYCYCYRVWYNGHSAKSCFSHLIIKRQSITLFFERKRETLWLASSSSRR